MDAPRNVPFIEIDAHHSGSGRMWKVDGTDVLGALLYLFFFCFMHNHRNPFPLFTSRHWASLGLLRRHGGPWVVQKRSRGPEARAYLLGACNHGTKTADPRNYLRDTLEVSRKPMLVLTYMFADSCPLGTCTCTANGKY